MIEIYLWMLWIHAYKFGKIYITDSSSTIEHDGLPPVEQNSASVFIETVMYTGIVSLHNGITRLYVNILYSFQEKPFTWPETSATFAKLNSRRSKLPSISAGSTASRRIPTGEKNFFMPPSKRTPSLSHPDIITPIKTVSRGESQVIDPETLMFADKSPKSWWIFWTRIDRHFATRGRNTFSIPVYRDISLISLSYHTDSEVLRSWPL